MTSIQSQETPVAASTFKANDRDSGSTEVQVVFLTERIDYLTEHFKTHVKDHSGRRGLLSLVSKRRSLLNYLKKKDNNRYTKLINSLGLRH